MKKLPPTHEHWTNFVLNEHTCGSSPSRDAAGVVGSKELGGPGNTDGSDGRVVLQTLVTEGKLLQLHQSDVVLITAGVVPAAQLTFCSHFFLTFM